MNRTHMNRTHMNRTHMNRTHMIGCEWLGQGPRRAWPWRRDAVTRAGGRAINRAINHAINQKREPFMPGVTTRARVAFVDVDSSQRIHYTALFRYMEANEHELMRRIGFPYATTLHGYAFPRVHVESDMRGAIRYDDVLEVEGRVERVGTSSWTIGFTLRYAPDAENAERSDGKSLAQGRITVVCMDPRTERAAPIPEGLRRALAAE